MNAWVVESQGGAQNAGPVIHVTTTSARPPLLPACPSSDEFDEKKVTVDKAIIINNADFDGRVFGSRHILGHDCRIHERHD
jgi:hypothetical protein